MKRSTLQKISFDADLCSGDLPLGFGSQAGAGPAGEGVGFEIAYVANRLIQIHWPHASACVIPPVVSTPLPVQWSLPELRPYCLPTFRKPQFRSAISVLQDELQEFPIGDQPRR